MFLLVGLGNPGPAYAANRHNIGFMAADGIVRRHGFSPWRKKFDGELAEGTFNGDKVLALKPMTYMNLSGQSVLGAVSFFKIKPAHVIVFHDEIDLAPGKLRVKRGGGHAGHNGLRSIHAAIGEGYGRVRMGVGHPGDKALVKDYVLKDFSKDDTAWLDPMLDGCADYLDLLLAGDDPGFMTKVAQKITPNRPAVPRPENQDKNKDGDA